MGAPFFFSGPLFSFSTICLLFAFCLVLCYPFLVYSLLRLLARYLARLCIDIKQLLNVLAMVIRRFSRSRFFFIVSSTSHRKVGFSIVFAFRCLFFLNHNINLLSAACWKMLLTEDRKPSKCYNIYGIYYTIVEMKQTQRENGFKKSFHFEWRCDF